MGSSETVRNLSASANVEFSAPRNTRHIAQGPGHVSRPKQIGRSNWNDRLCCIARGRDRNRAGGVSRYVSRPSLSAREEAHARKRVFDDTGDIATPTGAGMSRQLGRPALFLEPASMWSATIPLSQ